MTKIYLKKLHHALVESAQRNLIPLALLRAGCSHKQSLDQAIQQESNPALLTTGLFTPINAPFGPSLNINESNKQLSIHRWQIKIQIDTNIGTKKTFNAPRKVISRSNLEDDNYLSRNRHDRSRA
jgi:hypothetical protein